MANSVFFSWQSDTPNAVGRGFLKDVLEEVCRRVSGDTGLDEAAREVIVDSDTEGVAGQPPVVQTILRKIDSAAVFVADMTFVGTRLNKKPTPNPNVLIEYGWAFKSLTHERVLCVMNEEYGQASAESLPFDLSHLRWPMRFSLSPKADSKAKAAEKERLIVMLTRAVTASLATIKDKPVAPADPFPETKPKNGLARFRSKGEALGISDDFSFRKTQEVFLEEGPAMWLKVYPVNNPHRQLTVPQLKDLVRANMGNMMPLLNASGGYSNIRAEDGVGMYRATGKEGEPVTTPSATFVFESGEVWSIDTSYLYYGKDGIAMTDTENAFAHGLYNYVSLLSKLGFKGPYRWQAGLTGIKNRRLHYADVPGGFSRLGPGPQCLANEVVCEGQYDSSLTAVENLMPFFKKIFEKGGISGPDYLPQK